MGVYIFTTATALTNTSASLEGIYQRSLYDLSGNVNNMEVEVSKLLVTDDSVSQQRILSNLKQQSSDAENSLSFLPVNNNMLTKTNRFMNQLNGYCSSLITYKDGQIEGKDYDSLHDIHDSLLTIQEELNSIMRKMMEGYRISDNMGFDESADFNVNFSPFYNESIKYPSLIYDGPFSESTVNKSVKGLKGDDIDEEKAREIVSGLFDSDVNIDNMTESNGKFTTYNFEVKKNNEIFYVQIAKKGGFVLSINSNMDMGIPSDSEGVKADSIDVDSNQSAIDVALNFAKKLNLDNMQSVWSASSSDVCYVNLAPVVDDIVLYPDLIKAKVNLKDMSVIGWEASSYAINHVEREDLIAQLSLQDARKFVSDNMTVDTERLCVIPLDFVGETLAYEFSGSNDGYHYYLYIDAYTGNQVRVLRVVQTDQGDLVL